MSCIDVWEVRIALFTEAASCSQAQMRVPGTTMSYRLEKYASQSVRALVVCV